jgi:SAM-dependent methyltransferase
MAASARPVPLSADRTSAKGIRMENLEWDEDQAQRYDIEHARIDTPVTIRYLSEMVNGGDILEFGVGTGRLAIPLAASARQVIGVDSSPHMLAVAACDPLPPNLTLVQGDAATWSCGQRFDLVLCVFNVLLHLTTQDAQIAVIRNAADHLKPDGSLIIENVHPPLRALEEGERITTLQLPGLDVAISTQVLDWKTFHLEQRTLYVSDGVSRTRTFTQRLLLPAEQDLMARLAGLRLVKRMSNWRGTPWRSDPNGPATSNVISTYQWANGSPAN